jgi:cAMP-dependent protein kinase regulator
MSADQISSLPQRSNRPRVAVPVEPPMLLPVEPRSLIPVDVLEAYEREIEDADREDSEDRVMLADELGVEDVEEENSGVIACITESPADPEAAIEALSRVDQFKGLPRASLEALAEGAMQCEVAEGEFLFVEGDAADSFFVVAEGTLEVLRRKDDREVALRHLSHGEAIGLFGLFSGQQRAACARAIGQAVVLQIPAEKLQAVIEQDSALHDRMVCFYQERILEGFLGSSRLFADVDSIARARMIGRFAEKQFKPGETVMNPGELFNLIGVVTHGALVLEDRAKLGQEARQFEVTQGQFIAVTSAMSGHPGRLRIYAGETTTVVLLGHKEMTELVRDYPALRNLPRVLPAHARLLDRDVFCGHTGVPGL